MSQMGWFYVCLNPPKGPDLLATMFGVEVEVNGQRVSIPRRVLISLRPQGGAASMRFLLCLNPPKGPDLLATSTHFARNWVV